MVNIEQEDGQCGTDRRPLSAYIVIMAVPEEIRFEVSVMVVALISANRKKGLLLRSVSPPLPERLGGRI